MAQTKPAWELLDAYYAFPNFATQDDAAQANAPGARNYLASEDDKHWFDPKADLPGEGKTLFSINSVPHVMYHRAFFGRQYSDGSGVLEPLVIPVAFAKRVNIIPTGTGTTNWPATGKTVPVPINPLLPTQILLRPNPFSPFQVRNTDVMLSDEEQQSTQAEILAGVRKILAHFGIS